VNRRFGGTYRFHLQGRKMFHLLTLVPRLHFSGLKMEAMRSSETSVRTRFTQYHTAEDGILLIKILFARMIIWYKNNEYVRK
jgi:hypothetical protein